MPLRKVKTESSDSLSLQWILHVKDYKLNIDRNKCVGCEICTLACPKEAIKLEKQPKMQGERARRARVNIDLDKCNFCGICDILCPFGAVRFSLNGSHALSVLEKESFPTLIREIKVDATKLTKDLKKSDKLCPLNLIHLKNVLDNGEEKATIEVAKDECPCCRLCETTLPAGTMKVQKFLQGKIQIDNTKCPEGCVDCLDACPIIGTLFLNKKNKVCVDERFCIYCGACKVICPAKDALHLNRTKIIHTPVSSGAWNKALERLASTVEECKELKAKGSVKAREAVEKLVSPKETH